MSTVPPVVFLLLRNVYDPVHASVVVTPLRHLLDRGVDVRLVLAPSFRDLFAPSGGEARRSLRTFLHEHLSGRTHTIVSMPRRIPMWSDASSIGLWLRRRYGKDASIVMHCGGAAAAQLGASLRRVHPGLRVIYQAWGLSAEEHLYHQGLRSADELPASSLPWHAQRIATEQDAARVADAIVCVSEEMKAYFVDRYGVQAERITVIPCCVNTDRFTRGRAERDEIRRALSIEDRLVVCYCGSLLSWQQPEESVRIYNRIRAIDPSAHFLGITTEPDKMLDIARRAGVPDDAATILRLPPDEVPAYLAAADVGLLLRADNVVNRTASPVKFGEYLASGTPVIMNEGIGDYSALVLEQGLGVVVEHDESDASLSKKLDVFLAAYGADRATVADRCARVADRQLSWTARSADLENLYRELVASPEVGAIG